MLSLTINTQTNKQNIEKFFNIEIAITDSNHYLKVFLVNSCKGYLLSTFGGYTYHYQYINFYKFFFF